MEQPVIENETFAVILALFGWGLKKAQAGSRENDVAPDFALTGCVMVFSLIADVN